MEYTIKQEAVQQVENLISEMPTKYGLPLLQILKGALTPVTEDADDGENLAVIKENAKPEETAAVKSEN